MILPVPRWSLRTLVLLASGALTLIAATGIVEIKAFAEPTTLKYALTVAAPLLVFLAASTGEPLRLFCAVTIIAAPLTAATAQLGGIRVSLLVPLLVADFALIVITPIVRGRRPSLRWAALLAFPLLLIPIVDSDKSKQFVVSLLVMIAVAIVVFYTARDEKGLRTVLIAVAIQVGIQAVIAIWNVDTGRTLNLYSSAGTTQYGAGYAYSFAGLIRPTGTFPDPISLGNAVAISIPTTLALLFVTRSREARLGLVLAIALAVAALILALDRTSWIGVVLGVAVTVALLPKVLRRRAASRVVLGAVAVAVIALAVGGSAVSGKLSSIFDPTGVQGVNQQEKGIAEGEQDRLQYWDVALHDGFLAHPLTGVGIGEGGQLILDHSTAVGAGVKGGTGQYANAASTYLELLAEAGVGAVALLIVFVSGLVADLRAAVRSRPVLAAGLAGAAAAMLVCWVTDVVVYYEAVAACEGVLLGSIAAAAAVTRSAEQEQEL